MKNESVKVTKDVEIIPCAGKWYAHVIGSRKHNIGHLWSRPVARKRAIEIQSEIDEGLIKIVQQGVK